MFPLILNHASPAWAQLVCLLTALVLSIVIGLDRQVRHKQAGIRTHSLVGLGAALFMVVSKHGFSDVLTAGSVVLDPSRVAAQIVSGVGFIGAGLVFVRHDQVRGLTTAASIWLTAAVGTAAGGGLVLPAGAVTAAYFAVVHSSPWLTRVIGQNYGGRVAVRVRYRDGAGVLRRVIAECTGSGFAVHEFSVDEPRRPDTTVEVDLQLVGRGPLTPLVSALSGLSDVVGIETDEEA